MFNFIISRLYFFLPAYITNMTPPLAAKFKILESLNKPVDNNKKINGLPVLGSHKTWRGVILGIINGIITVFIQRCLYQFPFFEEISLFNYQYENVLLFGFLISGGAVLGDLVSASVKRRLDLKPGARFMPWDQINYVIGASIILSLFSEINLKLTSWLVLIFLTFFLHIITNLTGYYLGLNNAKW